MHILLVSFQRTQMLNKLTKSSIKFVLQIVMRNLELDLDLLVKFNNFFCNLVAATEQLI